MNNKKTILRQILMIIALTAGMTSYSIAQCPIMGPAHICYNATGVTYNITGMLTPPAPGWTTTASFITITSSTSTSVTVDAVSAGTVTLVYTSSGVPVCSKVIVVDPLPTIVLSGTQTEWIGNTVTFTPSMGGGTWNSDDPSIASVSGGVVTGVATGSTTISYALSTPCGTAYATRTVTVNPYITTPSNSPVTGPNPAFGVTNLNTAFFATSSSFSGHNGLYAFASSDGSTSYDVALWEDQSSIMVHIGNVILSGVTGAPDVTLGDGNFSSAGQDDYVLVVAYPTSTSVKVDYYPVTISSGPTTLGSSLATHSYSYTSNTVHIDGIANSHNATASPYNYPDTRFAAVTWDDVTNGKVYAAYLDLNTNSGTPTEQLIDNGKDPDVAAVNRYASGSGTDYALITYTNIGNSELYYREWDMTGTSLSTTVTLDAMTGSSAVSIPRIDGMDNYNVNDPSGATESVYKIAAQVYNDGTGYNEIRTYCNLLGAANYWTCSDVEDLSPVTSSSPLYNHYTPCVALAQDDYMIAHFMDDGTNDIVTMQPIVKGDPSALGGGKDYWVSDGTPVGTSGYYACSASPLANRPNVEGLIAWGYPDGGGGTYIKYKTTPYTYSFKHGNNEGTGNAKESSWTVYPNPAHDYVVVSAPGGAAGSYELTDLAGKVLLQGNINSGQKHVNIGALAAGSYLLQLHGAAGNSTQLIVKD